MNITDKRIDDGKPFDWGRTSEDYAKYRDIYPKEFYDKIISRGLCVKGQKVLDIGTGTGVLPRNLYGYGAQWTATDISSEQIETAKRMSEGMDIKYFACAAEDIDLPANTFDVITACQCYWYFHHDVTSPLFAKLLKENGRMLWLYMAWLPFEDKIAGKSEELVLRYNPGWSGARETMHPISVPDEINEYFDVVMHDEFKLMVPFTRESWNGRMKACRGVGASLSPEDISSFESEHKALLESIAPERFEVLHYASMVELVKK